MKPTLLVVDDYPDILLFLSSKLSDKFNVLTASNVASATEILQSEIVNVIVTDIMMPTVDGFSFCRQIKSNFDTCHIPVILLTAMEGLESKINGLESGADAYIEKPFSPKHLEKQISNLLENRNKLKDFFAVSPLALLKSIAYIKTDELFLDQLSASIHKNLGKVNFDIDQVAKELNMSRATLFRKVKGVTNLTPAEFINVTRLKKAATLLREGHYKVFEVANMVGFSSQAHFAKCFLKQFKMTATEFVLKCRSNEAM